MKSPDHATPPSLYVLAMAVGLAGLPFIFLLAGFVISPHAAGGDWSWSAQAWFAVGYAVLGALFGLVWPEPTWRWGLWLTAMPLCLVYLLDLGGWVWLGLAVQTALPACSAAYAAARLHLKYAEVDEEG